MSLPSIRPSTSQMTSSKASRSYMPRISFTETSMLKTFCWRLKSKRNHSKTKKAFHNSHPQTSRSFPPMNTWPKFAILVLPESKTNLWILFAALLATWPLRSFSKVTTRTKLISGPWVCLFFTCCLASFLSRVPFYWFRP
jgi:hypothetical protein